MAKKIEQAIKYPNEIIEKFEKFERFLENKNYTPEHKERLDKIKKNIKVERKQNYTNSKRSKISRLFDVDNFNLKPNIYVFGIDINKIIEKLKK